MSRTRTYRCLACRDHTVSRSFDVASLSLQCPVCTSFERFLNETVYKQFAAFEAEPPADLAWDRLDRLEKLVVCERLVRSDKTLADFAVEE